MADGPVIQLGNERALRHGVTLDDVMAVVARFRQDNDTTPVAELVASMRAAMDATG